MPAAFLKWAGGKTRYTTQLAACAPAKWERLVEPFMGSAALFFAMAPDRALLADLNADLVVCFQEVARDHRAVARLLDQMPNTKDFFLAVRAQDPEALSPAGRAARVIYLNKTCFRGLWRVNKQGKFNVPYGAYDRPLYNLAVVREAAALLNRAEIRCESYERTMAAASAGDWVYLDPPYVPAGGHSDFKRYTANQFRADDHERLADACRSLTQRGIPFLLTNTNNQEARDLYAGFNLAALSTKRDIALQADRRASSDLVVSNYELPAGAPVTPLR